MRDGAGHSRAVIETIELTQRRFPEVDAAFAYDEGEGDRTLSYWRKAHETYFTRLGQFAPTCFYIASASGLLRLSTLEQTSPASEPRSHPFHAVSGRFPPPSYSLTCVLY